MPNTNTEYYQQMKLLALEKRELYNVETSKLNLNVIRRIYKKEGITIDLWDPMGRKIKACYAADGEPSVMVNRNLPRVPRLFAMVHELKHHYVDREGILGGVHECGAYNENRVIEIGAEVFAAQFVYPDHEMLVRLDELGVPQTGCTAEAIVRFKHSCGALISYQSLVKRFIRFGRIEKDLCEGVQFTKLEEEIFGLPVYKRPSFINARKRKSGAG